MQTPGDQGKSPMRWSMDALACGGFRGLVVNTAWLGEKISDHFGPEFLLQTRLTENHRTASITRPGQVQIAYSHEGHDFGGTPETAGGIVRALPKPGNIFGLLAGTSLRPALFYPKLPCSDLPPVKNLRISVWCPMQRTTTRAILVCHYSLWARQRASSLH